MALELYELLDEATGKNYFVVSDSGLEQAIALAKNTDPSITDLELVDKIGEQIGSAALVFLGET